MGPFEGERSLEDPVRAVQVAQVACARAEAEGHTNLWNSLDTLASAQHRAGNLAAAIRTQRRSVDLMPDGADQGHTDRLATYEAEAAAATTAQPDGQ